MENPAPSLRLSTEELLFLLWLLNTPSLPGMGANPFGNWTETEIAAALASAERSLRARCFISKTPEGQIQMDQVVMALIGACAVPQFSVCFVGETPQTGRVARYFHVTPFLAVEHTNPEAGIHFFTALPDTQAIFKRLEELLGLDDHPAPSDLAVEVSLIALQEAAQAAQNGEAQAQQVIERCGVEKASAAALATTLTRIRLRATLVFIYNLRGEQPRSDGMAILQGPNGFWLLQTEGEEANSIVHIQPNSSEQIRFHLQEFLLQAHQTQ